MRKLCILFLPFLIVCGLCWYVHRFSDRLVYPPALSKHAFDQSLGIKEFGRTFVLHRSRDRDIRRVARLLIEKRQGEWKKGALSSIPLIIHQFWLSKAPLPDDLARASRLVQQQHPGFRYVLWKLRDIHDLLYGLIGPTYTSLPSAVLKEIASAAILWQYGGVSVDLESECVHPITALLPLGDCLIGFEPPRANTSKRRRLFLSSSVIAAVPSHPIIHTYLAEMIHQVNSCAGKNPHEAQNVMQGLLTDVISKTSPEQGRLLLLGPTYFCPVSFSHIHHFKRVLNFEVRQNPFKKALRTIHVLSAPPFSDISRETIFVDMSEDRLRR